LLVAFRLAKLKLADLFELAAATINFLWEHYLLTAQHRLIRPDNSKGPFVTGFARELFCGSGVCASGLDRLVIGPTQQRSITNLDMAEGLLALE